jgi:hypothetical protein
MAITVFEAISAASQIAEVVAIVFLYKQIQLSKTTTQCQLINDLEKEFTNYYGVLAKLKPDGPWAKSAILSSDEVGQLENLASFCEKLKHFKDRGVLDWNTLDLMFRNRFFLILDNENVLKLVIEPCRNDWKTLLTLEKEWRDQLPITDRRAK